MSARISLIALYYSLLLALDVRGQEASEHVDIRADHRAVVTMDRNTLAVVDHQSPRKVQVWDLRTRQISREMQLPDSSKADAICCSSDSRYVSVGTDKGSIVAWRLGEDRPPTILRHDDRMSAVSHVFMSHNGTCVAGFQKAVGNLVLWSLDELRPIATISAVGQSVIHCAFSRDGKEALVIFDTEVWRAHLATGVSERVAEGLSVLAVNQSFDTDNLVVQMPGSIEMWSVTAFKRTKPLKCNSLASVAFMPGSSRVLIGRLDDNGASSIELWDMREGPDQANVVRSVVERRSKAPPAMDVSGSLTAFTASDGRTIYLSSRELTGKRAVGNDFPLDSGEAAITHVSVTTDGARVLTAFDDGLWRVWRTESGRLMTERRATLPIETANFVGGDATILLRSPDRIQLLDAAGDQFTPSIITIQVTDRDQRRDIVGFDVSPDNRHIAVKTNTAVSLFDTTGRNLGSIPQQPILFGYSIDGDTLLLITTHNRYLYEAEIGVLKEVKDPDTGMLGITYSNANGQVAISELLPNGPASMTKRLRTGDRILAASEGNGEMQSLENKSNEEINNLFAGPIGTTIRLRIQNARGTSEVEIDRKMMRPAPDGKGWAVAETGLRRTVPRMISGISRNRRALWDPGTGRIVALLSPGAISVNRGRQSTSIDGTLSVVVGPVNGRDGEMGLEVRDILSDEIITEMPLQIDSYNGISFTPNGDRVLVSTDRTVVVVDYRRGEVAKTLAEFKRVTEKKQDGGNPGAAAVTAARDLLAFGPIFEGRFTCMAVSSHGLIAVGTDKGEIRFLAEHIDGPIHVQREGNHPIRSVKFADDGTKLFYVVRNTLNIMDLSNWIAPRWIRGPR